MEGSYRRNLPHWRCEGATYFLTFRLNDSLPEEVVRTLREEREEWRRQIARERLAGPLSAATLKAWHDLQRRHFLKTEAIMDAGYGACIPRDPQYRKIVAAALQHFEGTRCRLAMWVIMPNHVHALCCPLPGFSIQDLSGSWKKHSAEKINRRRGRPGQLWQRETFDRIVRDAAEFERTVEYIVQNPIKARLRADETEIWSAT